MTTKKRTTKKASKPEIIETVEAVETVETVEDKAETEVETEAETQNSDLEKLKSLFQQNKFADFTENIEEVETVETEKKEKKETFITGSFLIFAIFVLVPKLLKLISNKIEMNDNHEVITKDKEYIALADLIARQIAQKLNPIMLFSIMTLLALLFSIEKK